MENAKSGMVCADGPLNARAVDDLFSVVFFLLKTRLFKLDPSFF